MNDSACHRTDEVWERLATVTDPELDESVTELGFVEQVSVEENGAVGVRFRLPTYWCAVNFAYLMADDMRRAVEALPWVTRVVPYLEDHMCAEAINEAAAEGRSFGEAFGESEDASLQALRATFRRKAFQRRQEAVLRALLSAGHSKAALAAMAIATLERTPIAALEGAAQKARYLEIRAEIGGPATPDARAFVTTDGALLTEEGFDAHLQALRSVRTAMEFNGTLCRALLAVREKPDRSRAPAA